MAVVLSPAGRHALVAQLRAAGCVYAEDEADVLAGAAGTANELQEWVARRAAGTPLEIVVGWADFCGIRVSVVPGVFVPRRRSESVVAVARALLDDSGDAGPPAVVVDLCCGAGPIAAALLASHPRLEVHAADIDPVAAQCARTNLAGTTARVYVGDLDEALPLTLRGRVDLMVANAPYVPTDEIALMPAEARDHEPRAALDGGDDGVALHRRIAAAAPRWLAPGGVLLIETSGRQAPLTTGPMVAAGLRTSVQVTDDGTAAVAVGLWTA